MPIRKPRLSIALVIALGMALAAPASSWQEPAPVSVYPASSWQKESPEALGWSPEGLARAREYAATIDTAAVMIVQGGVVVDEWGQTTRKLNVHSVRKSLLSALIGIYEARGVLKLESTLEELGIDDRLGLTAGERRARFIDLLGSRSGVYHPANLVAEGASRGWPARGSHPPGTHWFYSNWDFNAAGAIFEQETSRGIFEAFDELIARPLGMEDYQPSDGLYEPRSGFGGAQGRSVSDFPAYVFRMSARDMARFGLLYLRKGQWNGRAVVPEAWVERTTRTDRAVSEFGGYEFFWWIGMGGRLYPGVDVGDGAFAAHGAGGHYITVLPAYDLVVVHRVDTSDRTLPVGGTNPGTSVSRSEYGKLLGLILDALKPRDLKVITSGGFTAAYQRLRPQFEQSTGLTVETAYGASSGGAPDSIPERLSRGEPADVIILSRSSLDALTARGDVRPDTRIDLVRSSIGMAVRQGAPKPDISSKEAFIETLLAAESIGYSASASGTYLSTELFPRLGLWERLRHKSVRVVSERVGAVVARGEVEIGFQQVSELLPIDGIDYVGPIPDEVQKITTFSAGITERARNPEGARALIDFLSSEAVAETIEATGLTPVVWEEELQASTIAEPEAAAPARPAARR